MKAHRAKLGLSAKDYGLLVGASMLSIYKWEDGKVAPRPKNLPRISEILRMGKREAQRKLAELQGA
jgi:DNA-binding XRE family transcriptional regulator